MNFRSHQPCLGQSITEYCVIIALVLMACVGGLIYLGGNVSGLLGGLPMLSDANASASLVKTSPSFSASKVASSAHINDKFMGKGLETSIGQNNEVVLSDGSVISLPGSMLNTQDALA